MLNPFNKFLENIFKKNKDEFSYTFSHENENGELLVYQEIKIRRGKEVETFYKK